MTRDKADIRADRQDIQTDRKDIARDRADIRADQRDLRSDSRDLRADRGDLHNDRGNFRSGEQGNRSEWQDQEASRNMSHSTPDHSVGGQHMEAAKPGITSSTVANNAAENYRKAQNTQTVHKAWYHVWW